MRITNDESRMTTDNSQLDADGYCVVPAVLSAEGVANGIAAWEAVCRDRAADDPAILKGEDGVVCGARNLLRLWPAAVEFVRGTALQTVLLELLGPSAGVVRGLYFDKPPGRGWALLGHKDYNIAVRSHGTLHRFRQRTTKAGAAHVEAPEELLRQMLAVRIHLDAMGDDNGPLRVIPGPHLAFEDADEVRSPSVIRCGAGDALLMRPLLTHASSHCEAGCGRHRRIVHLECAPSPELPDGYEWRDFVAI
ncbi:MAG TPA: phytanoyl-CoA dioxygenase family protein [Gemmataceae bacterium]